MSGGFGSVMFTAGLNDLKGLFQTTLILWFTQPPKPVKHTHREGLPHLSPGDISRLVSAFPSLQNVHVLPRYPHNHCQGLGPQMTSDTQSSISERNLWHSPIADFYQYPFKHSSSQDVPTAPQSQTHQGTSERKFYS